MGFMQISHHLLTETSAFVDAGWFRQGSWSPSRPYSMIGNHENVLPYGTGSQKSMCPQCPDSLPVLVSMAELASYSLVPVVFVHSAIAWRESLLGLLGWGCMPSQKLCRNAQLPVSRRLQSWVLTAHGSFCNSGGNLP